MASSSSTGSGPVSIPLQIATAFTKQYYHIRSCNNPITHKFYKSESRVSLSSSRGASASTWILGEASDPESRFSWAANSRIDFTNGSIDAQESSDGGVLVVVMAEMRFPDDGSSRRSFVQTFVLKDDGGGPRKNYYVLNDVTRFLDDADEKVGVGSGGVGSGAVAVEPPPPAVEAPVEEDVRRPPDATPPAPVVVDRPSSSLLLPPEADSTLLDDNDFRAAERIEEERLAAAAAATVPPTDQQHKPPGSWASLVAGSSAPAVDAADPFVPALVEPSLIDKPTDEGDTVVNDAKDGSSSGAGSGAGGSVERSGGSVARSGGSYGSKGSSSLYVKNVVEGTTEADLRNLFSEYPFKIVNVSFYPSRGYAFVDFADADAVGSIMTESSRRTFHINGRAIEVEKKSTRRTNSRRPNNSSSGNEPRHHHHQKDRRRGGGRGGGARSNKRNGPADDDNGGNDAAQNGS